MNDYKEYLETGILGSYRPEKELPASGSVKC